MEAMRFRIRVVFHLILLGLFLFTVPAWAGDAMESIRVTTDRILEILRDPAFQDKAHREKRKDALREIVDQRFDWEAFARSSLTTKWRELNESQRKEFTRLFSRLLERTYLEKLEEHSIDDLRKIEYLEEETYGDRAKVRVNIKTNRNEEIPVEYRLKKGGDQWLVYDILIEGVSLVKNYRVQFNEILGRSSYSELVERLRAKVQETS